MGAKPLKVALLGAGVVGSEVARLLVEQADDLAERVGAPLELVGVGVRRVDVDRGPWIPPELVTADLDELVSGRGADIVVELMGGIDPARQLILAAFASGASVITGNKALLAQHGAELHEACDAAGLDLYFEASVAGAIPLLRPLRESLAGDRVQRVLGIVNGTTNYILTRMDESGASYDDALAEAQELGYAEKPDPSADVEGHDAAAKAAIIASLAFHSRVTIDDVYCEGISAITASNVAAAKAAGYVVKLLAVAERSADERGISVRVHPAMVSRQHPLAAVREAYNAVFVESDAAGQLMFYGPGAGGAPTASAVVGDIVAVARNRMSGGHGPRESAYAALPVLPVGVSLTRYYIAMDLTDKAGVLASVAAVFAEHDVSIETLRQEGHGDDASLEIVTHDALESCTGRDVHQSSRARLGPSDHLDHAGGGRMSPVLTQATRQWRGIIDEYRDRLPVTEATPVISLREGGTPLVRANVVSERTGCDVWLKVEGANPTGSFKDRGMTMAISRAAEEGAQAVICASTGNTSASAAAYAVRAGMVCAVLVPQGKIALGKLSQALAHGARLLQVDGNFDDCLNLARDLSDQYPVALVNSVNPARIEGQKTAAFEIVDQLGDAPDIHALPVGNAGNITAYWRGYREYADDGVSTRRPRMWGFQAAGAAPIVRGEVVPKPSTVATAIRIGNPASWQFALEARDESGGLIDAVTDREILAAYRLLASQEGVFVEPASASGVAGLLKKKSEGLLDDGQTVVCTVTGHGLKDPDWAIAGAPQPVTVAAEAHAAASLLGLIQ